VIILSGFYCVFYVTFFKDFVLETSLGSNIIFLTSEDQRHFFNDFVDGLPWNSFGRKNVGYLFAIARGAKVIWDFDDDNFLKFWMAGAALDRSLDINTFADPEGNGNFYFYLG
jgi:hypothetical protein